MNKHTRQIPLCMGCMAQIKDEDACPYCGYTKTGVFLSSYLAPETFLADRYIIGKLISYNGEGALYMAYDEKSDTKVIVREYMPDTLCGRKKGEEAIEVNSQFVALYKTYLSEFIELNKSLMNTDASLRVQKVMDVFSENNTAYAVCEYISGISLKTYLSNLGGVLPWEQVKELFAPLFTTLSLLHSEGIIHRGISPSTILLNDKSEPVLINFGITAVRTFGSEINYDVFAGYAGPEQYSTVERHGSWTDVYGLSAVLYKVLTGQMPVSASERKKPDGTSELTAPMLINRNVPAPVSAAIMKGLELDVGDRTRTIGVLINGLFEATPVSVPDSTNEILIKKPTRKAEPDTFAKPSSPRPPAKSSGHGRKPGKGNSGYAGALIGFTVLGIAILATILAIVFSDKLNERFNPQSGEDAGSPPNSVNTGTELPPAPPDNPAPETPPVTDSGNPQQPSSQIILPDYTGRQFESIQNDIIVRNNLLVFIPVYEHHDEYFEGFVFEQDIESNTPVAAGTEITVKVSKGPEATLLPEFETDGKRLTYTEYAGILSAAKIKFIS
ncbi:MAG: protein kinase, partial [Oscillospiraceae bacterium]|nr:protein kinase [Oscillospiraceae bacterium]